MRVRPQLVAAALVVALLVLTGCGGGSKNAAEPLPTTPTLTVPGSKATPSVGKRSTGTTGATGAAGTQGTDTTTTPTTTTQANPSTPAGGAAPPQTGGATPDTQQNDQSPPAGSPAQKFEEFCKDNPGAC